MEGCSLGFRSSGSRREKPAGRFRRCLAISNSEPSGMPLPAAHPALRNAASGTRTPPRPSLSRPGEKWMAGSMAREAAETAVGDPFHLGVVYLRPPHLRGMMKLGGGRRPRGGNGIRLAVAAGGERECSFFPFSR